MWCTSFGNLISCSLNVNNQWIFCPCVHLSILPKVRKFGGIKHCQRANLNQLEGKILDNELHIHIPKTDSKNK